MRNIFAWGRWPGMPWWIEVIAWAGAAMAFGVIGPVMFCRWARERIKRGFEIYEFFRSA